MVDLRDIINQKYLGLLFHEEDLPRKEDIADLLYEESDCSFTKYSENLRGNDSPELEVNDNAVLLADNVDETDNLAEGCRRNLFKHTLFWMKTELLLLQLQEGNFFRPELLETIIEFEDETEIGCSDGDSDWSCQNMQETEITRSRNFQSSLKISETSFPKAWGSETQHESLLHKESSRFGEFDSFKVLRKQVDNFRTLFLQLINDVVLPCDDKIRGLIKEILGIRRDEGELISLGSGTCNELSIISENLRDHTANDGVYWQERLKGCTIAIRDMCTKMEKTQNDLALLETWFSDRTSRITGTITRISCMRDQVLEDYYLFYESNASHEIFRSKNLHRWCNVADFKKKTVWYSDINVEEFKNTLCQNLKALAASNESIDRMIKKMHEYLAEVNGYTDLWQLKTPGYFNSKIKKDGTFKDDPNSYSEGTEKKISTPEGTPTQKSKHKRKRTKASRTKKLKKRSSTQFA